MGAKSCPDPALPTLPLPSSTVPAPHCTRTPDQTCGSQTGRALPFVGASPSTMVGKGKVRAGVQQRLAKASENRWQDREEEGQTKELPGSALTVRPGSTQLWGSQIPGLPNSPGDLAKP